MSYSKMVCCVRRALTDCTRERINESVLFRQDVEIDVVKRLLSEIRIQQQHLSVKGFLWCGDLEMGTMATYVESLNYSG